MSLEIGKVKVKVEVDDKESDKKISGLQEKFKSFGGKIAGTLAGLGTTALTAATGAIVGMTSAAMDQVASFEQLKGGIETLYAEYDELGNVITSSAEDVMKNATNAYKTAGMSANEYMETSIQFAASLKKSVGGDMQALADYTDMAITDMADNVNKLGTSMEGVQNAYRGFSRGNFSMLDNLALGYSGTKEGMQELLDKANELNAEQGKMTEYSIDSFSDIVEAIHVVQEEMKITGTTMKEAEGTIEGSTRAAKAAWDNFLIGVGDPQEVADTVLNMGEVMFSNFMQIVPRLVEAGIKLIEGLMQGLTEKIPDSKEAISNVIREIVSQAETFIPVVLEAGLALIGGLIDGLLEALPDVINAISRITLQIISSISEKLPEIIEGGFKLVVGLAQGLLNALPDLLIALGTLAGNMVKAFFETDWISIGLNIIDGIASGIWNGAGKLLEAAKNAAVNAFNAAKNWLGISSPSKRARDEIGKQIPAGMAEGVEESSGVFEDALNDLSKNAFGNFASDINYNMPELSGYAQDLGMNLSYASERQINVPVILNGREIARATAWDMGEQLAWEER